MNGITRYIVRQLVIGVIFVAIGLTAVMWLTQSLRFVEMIVDKGASIGTFIYLTLLLLPNFLTIVLPIALFSVILFTYNKMAVDRELVVMRAVGLGQTALAVPAMLLTLVVVLISYSINLYFLPLSYTKFRELQFSLRHDLSSLFLREGTFNEIGAQLVVYVRQRQTNGELLGLLVHDTRSATRPITLMAERGAMVNGPDGPRVLLVNGNRQEVSRKDGKLSLLYFDQYTVEIGAKTEEPANRFREARERTVFENLAVDAREVGSISVGKFHVEAHQRLSNPLLVASFGMIAVTTLLSGGFSRHGQTARILAAIGMAVALQAGFISLANTAARNLHMVPLIYVLAALPIPLAYLVLTGLVRLPRRKQASTVAAPPDEPKS